MSKAVEYRPVEFDQLVGEFGNIQSFKPTLPEGWFYLGPVAFNTDSNGPLRSKHGLIFKAVDSSALDDIADWTQVFQDIEGRNVSVWRPVPRNPDKYVAGGDLFINGVDKPTKEQTAGIKAIRKDLTGELQPNHAIGEIRFPKALLSFWGIGAIPLIYVATGAFVATGAPGPDGLTIPAILFFVGNAW